MKIFTVITVLLKGAEIVEKVLKSFVLKPENKKINKALCIFCLFAAWPHCKQRNSKYIINRIIIGLIVTLLLLHTIYLLLHLSAYA